MSRIEWTQKTWNPITGCTKVSQGCKHCYAETMSKRLCTMKQNHKYRNGFQVTVHPEAFGEPLLRKRSTLYFVCSMGDLFHEEVSFSTIDHIMDIITQTPHTYLILTKRSSRMRDFFVNGKFDFGGRSVPHNVWLGVTTENTSTFLDRFEYFSEIPHHQKFLSCEPLLDDVSTYILPFAGHIQWVIVGGESGPKKVRRMEKKWVESIKINCQISNVPFFFKQWGAYGEDGVKRSKTKNGHLLNGKVYRQVPESLAPFF